MNNERCTCKKCELALFGREPDQTDGVVWICTSNSQTLHGSKENPGGLVQEVQEIKKAQVSHSRLIWIGTGFILAVQIGWGIYLALKH